jgi:hypothetical protein
VGEEREVKYEGVSDETLEKIARDVRAFDKSLSPEDRTRKAVEKIAEVLAKGQSQDWQEQDYRRREVECQEIMAVAAILGNTRLMHNEHFAPLLKRYGVEVTSE